MSKKFVQILLPLSLDDSFCYFCESKIAIGNVVKVEFGKKQLWGVVVEILEALPCDLDEKKVKPILQIHDRVCLSKSHLEFIAQIANYNIANQGLILRAFIGILNSDKTKKTPLALLQDVDEKKFNLKKLLTKQSETYLKIANSKESSISLLDGVTGSGKTEVYFKVIADILKNSKDSQILILLPEIALTSQLLLRFQEQFGFPPALWHSKITPKNKREIFYGIVEGSTRVIIGARSALLLPFKNLKLIVIDEEHDASFKQEDVFNFHARDMAILKAKIEKFKVILSSATPAIETYNNAISKKFDHYILEQRFGQKNEVSLVDLRKEKLPKNSFLSQPLVKEIANNIEKKELSLLFLNRRGYAPVTMCTKCGYKYSCSNCDSHFVLHKKQNKLVCHHCGETAILTNKCISCNEEGGIISLGIGVEKLEDEVRLSFPDAKIALATSDSLQNFDDAKKFLNQVLNDEIDIIIGTQMIAKGYDFAKLTLVGIVDIDSMLYSSEIKALEKSYQILTQVIGRAGRDKLPGRVMIQTYNPDNFLFKQIAVGSKKDFYNFEINNRKTLELPPFSRMVKIEVSAFLQNDAKNFARKIINAFPVSNKIEIFGPAPAAIQRLKNRHHFLVNIKADRKVNIQKLIKDVLEKIMIPANIRVRINVDDI